MVRCLLDPSIVFEKDSYRVSICLFSLDSCSQAPISELFIRTRSVLIVLAPPPSAVLDLGKVGSCNFLLMG